MRRSVKLWLGTLTVLLLAFAPAVVPVANSVAPAWANQSSFVGEVLRFTGESTSSYSGTGDIWSDISGQSNDAVRTGTPAPSWDNSTKGFDFSGTSDGEFTLPSLWYDFSGGLTIHVEADFGSGDSWEQIFVLGSGAEDVQLGRNGSTSDLRYAYKLGVSASTTCISSDAIVDGLAAYTVVIQPDQSCSMYRDGVELATTASGTLLPTGGQLTNNYLGAGRDKDYQFGGSIRSLRLLNTPDTSELAIDVSGRCTQAVEDSTNVTVATFENDCVVTFANPGTTVWTVPNGVTSVQFLIVGGGGGGGTGTASEHGGGGGGAGGFLSGTTSLTSPTYSITVGAGGTGGDEQVGGSGANSSFAGQSAIGGGGGGAWKLDGLDGGSGGGAGSFYEGQTPISNPGSETVGQGNAGGSVTVAAAPTFSYSQFAAGGGGAGGVGGPGATEAEDDGSAGDGGLGVSSAISGSSAYYAAGGGGGGWTEGGNGGSSIGGNGADGNPFSEATAGAVNTGSGGGGGIGKGGANKSSGANGGSGIVIIRYSLNPDAPTSLSANAQNGQVKLSWVAPAHTGGSSITDYSIRYRPSGGSWQTFADGTSSDTSAIVTGLSNGTAYEFQVSVTAGGYTGDNSTTANATPSVSARGSEAVLTTGASNGTNNNGLSTAAEVIPTDVTVGTGFTVEMWVYPQNLEHTYNTLLYQHSGVVTTNYDRFGMNIRNNGEVQVILDASNDGSPGTYILNYQKPGGTVTTNEWTHVGLVVKYLETKKFSAEVFINGLGLGVVEQTTSNNLDSPASGLFRMGYNPAFSGREFDGHLDQFKVWDVALTQAQLAASKGVYSASDSTPPLSDLRLHHDFNALDGSDVDEVSGDGTYDFETVRSPTVPDEVDVSISSQPSNVTITRGNSTTVSVTAGEGSAVPTTLTYQWQQDTGSGFSDIAGATSASYTSPTLGTSDSGLKYRAVITSSIAYEIETVTTSEAVITVDKTSQTVNLGSIGSQTYGDAITVTANPTSGLSPTFATSTPAVCTIDTTTGELTVSSVGTCTVTADQAGDAIYSAASQESESFTISAKPITVAVTVADKVYDAGTTATVSSGVLSGVVSGDLVSFVAANATAAFGTAAVASGKSLTVTLDGDELSGADAGNYSLTVSGSPTASITAKPITVNVTPAGKTYDGTQSVLSFTSSLSGLESGDTVSVDADEVSVVFDAPGAGTQSASATFTSSVLTGADADNYSASLGTVASAVIAKASQASLSFSSASSVVFGQTLTLVATGGSGSGAITYGASGDCSLSSGVITPTGAGSCAVTATRAADSNYLASSAASQTVTVSKANQSINFTSTVPVSAVSGTTYTPTATATSGLTVSFAITTGDGTVCSLSSGVVTFAQSGTCVITASQAGDTDYNVASSVTQTIVAGKINQTITFPSIAGKDFDDAAFSAGASVSSGRSVTYATSTGSVCAVTPSTGVVSIKTVGECTVTASSAGDASYAAASDVSRTFTISPVLAGRPSITSVSFGDSSVTVAFVAPGFVGGDAIDGYQVVATSTGGSVTKPDCATSSPCTITGLTNGTSYTLTVAAVNAAGVGPASDASPSIVPATIADAVSGLATTPGDEELVVSWTALTTDQVTAAGGTFTRYDVYLRVNGGSWGSAVTPDGTNNLATRTTTSYTFTGLTNGTAYDVKVVAITNANSTELSSNTSTALGVPATTPAAVSGLTATALSNTTALASWSAPLDDGGAAVTAYSVNLSCTFVNATDTFCELSGLTAGSTVTVTVGATNLMGTGSSVSVSVTMPGGSSGGSGGGSPGSQAVVAATDVPVVAPRRVIVPVQPTPLPRLLAAPVRIIPERGFDPTAGAKARVGGQPATVTKKPLGDGGLSVEVGAFQLGIKLSTPGSSEPSGAGQRSDIDVPTGQSTKVSGGGLLPGSSLQVWLPGMTGESPRELARIPVQSDGSFASELSFTSRQSETPIPIGPQVMQVTGYDEQGNQTIVDMVVNIGQGAPAPEPNRSVNELPDLSPGQSLATSAGTPETVTVEATPQTGEVAVLSEEWAFTVTVAEDSGGVERVDSGATITMVQTKTASVSGEGFQPETRVDIWLFSDPTLLGSVIVAADGSFTGEVYVDARYATPGEHTLQLQGVAEDGFIKAANLGVLVQEPVEVTMESARGLLWWVAGAFLLLLLVVFFVIAARRRRA